jgi:hypothetical protein
MTQAITSRHPSRLLSRLATWTTRPLERLSDRIHAGGEATARQNGWEITRATGRLGLGARTYHDPRFTHLAADRGGPSQHYNAGDREEGTNVRGNPIPLR